MRLKLPSIFHTVHVAAVSYSVAYPTGSGFKGICTPKIVKIGLNNWCRMCC